jgi:hypothetical protein
MLEAILSGHGSELVVQQPSPIFSVEAYAVELSRVLEAKALVKNR